MLGIFFTFYKITLIKQCRHLINPPPGPIRLSTLFVHVNKHTLFFTTLLHKKMNSTVNFNVIFYLRKFKIFHSKKTFILKIPRLYCFLQLETKLHFYFNIYWSVLDKISLQNGCLTTFGPFIKDVINFLKI